MIFITIRFVREDGRGLKKEYRNYFSLSSNCLIFLSNSGKRLNTA